MPALSPVLCKHQRIQDELHAAALRPVTATLRAPQRCPCHKVSQPVISISCTMYLVANFGLEIALIGKLLYVMLPQKDNLMICNALFVRNSILLHVVVHSVVE